jgi:hypothetical protein
MIFPDPCPAFRPHNLINQISSPWGGLGIPSRQGSDGPNVQTLQDGGTIPMSGPPNARIKKEACQGVRVGREPLPVNNICRAMILHPKPVTPCGSPCPLPGPDPTSDSAIPATASLSITLTLSDAAASNDNMGSKFWPKRGSPGILHHFVRFGFWR